MLSIGVLEDSLNAQTTITHVVCNMCVFQLACTANTIVTQTHIVFNQEMPVRFAPPHISVERSRSQVLCRTGRRGKGQSFTLKFGAGQKFMTEDQAYAEAESWLIAERHRTDIEAQ